MLKDNKGQIIQKGQTVACVDPIEGYLKLNATYEVLDLLEASGRIVVNPDARGKEGHYKSTRFVIIEEGAVSS